ncbi:MAG: hypothetical protein JXR37_23595 [Kiritimatiellae bacterium]|nr:hypothetical protein [Kiritimatiellia bacterium]
MKESAVRRDSHAIQPYGANPFYWQYKGKPLLLLGASDDDNLFQWTGEALTDQLDLLKSVGGNYLRNTMSDRDRVGLAHGLNVDNVFAFKLAEDGKYDLDQWNDEYWERLEFFLIETVKRDIIVQLTLWDIHDLRGEIQKGATGGWDAHPWNPKNNVNYTAESTGIPEQVDTSSPEKQAEHPFFRTVPALNDVGSVLELQQKFVRRILTTTLCCEHVLYNVENEALTPTEWMDYWADFVRREAAGVGRAVFLTGMRRDTGLLSADHKHVIENDELYDYVDISQNNANSGQQHYDNAIRMRSLVEAAGARPINNVKIYKGGVDEADAVFGEGAKSEQITETARRFWRNVFAGCASSRFHRPVLMEDGVRFGIGLNSTARAQIRGMRMVEEALTVFTMTPHDDLVSGHADDGAYCLAEQGKQYAVYFPNGGAANLNLSAATTPMRARWLNVDAGEWGPEQEQAPGTAAELVCPAAGQWVVVVRA